jgi:hypothetical protein
MWGFSSFRKLWSFVCGSRRQATKAMILALIPCGDMTQHRASDGGTFTSRPRLIHSSAVTLKIPG